MTSRIPSRTRATTLAATLLGVFTPALAFAEVTDAASCVSAHELAQRERVAGHYQVAKEAARACSSAVCNEAIIGECVRLYEEILAEIPTVVFSARDRNGNELVDVRVTVDGQLRAERLEGRPIELDPGPRSFRFEAPGLPVLDTVQTVRVGDRNRLIEVVLEGKEPDAARPADPSGAQAPLPPVTSTAQEGRRGVPLGAYALAGAGVLAIGAYAYLRLNISDEYDDLLRSCSPRCAPEKGDPIRTKIALSYAALGVGAAALGGAVLVYVLRSDDDESASELRFGVGVTSDAATARFSTRF